MGRKLGTEQKKRLMARPKARTEIGTETGTENGPKMERKSLLGPCIRSPDLSGRNHDSGAVSVRFFGPDICGVTFSVHKFGLQIFGPRVGLFGPLIRSPCLRSPDGFVFGL